MGGDVKNILRSLGGLHSQRLYEEIPLGPKIMISHPARVWSPPTDVFECDDTFLVKMSIPGLKRNQKGELTELEVFVEEETLVIRGERSDACTRKRCRVYQMEVYYGPFEFRVRFGSPIKSEGISAEYSEGFLEIVVPKSVTKPPQSRRIEINS